MGMIKFEDLKAKLNRETIPSAEMLAMAEALKAAAEKERLKGKNGPAAKMEQFSEGFRKFSALKAEDDPEEAYRQISGFSEFITGGEPGQLSNYGLVTQNMDLDSRLRFNGSLRDISGYFDMGISPQQKAPQAGV